MEKDYQTLLDRLHAGEITEFEIETAEFMDFQKILLNYNVVGTAKRGGGVIYHYHKNDK